MTSSNSEAGDGQMASGKAEGQEDELGIGIVLTTAGDGLAQGSAHQCMPLCSPFTDFQHAIKSTTVSGILHLQLVYKTICQYIHIFRTDIKPTVY